MEAYLGVGEIMNLTTIKMDIGQNTQSFSLYASFTSIRGNNFLITKCPDLLRTGHCI